MTTTHTIRFRVTHDQHQRIKHNAHHKGHHTISAYLRQLALKHDLERERWLERILLDIHRAVIHPEPDNRPQHPDWTKAFQQALEQPEKD